MQLVPDTTPTARLLGWIDAKRWWLAGFAAALHAASFSGVWRVVPDSAVYRGTARNAATGLGWVFNEQPYTHGFAGFPLLLSWIQRAIGDAAWPGVLVVHAMGLLAVGCTFSMLRRHCGRPTAVLVTFAFAVNSTLVRHCGELLADVPFLLGCALTLLGYEWTFRRTDEPPSRRLWIGAALLMLCGITLMASMRIVVLVPLAAIAIDVLWRTRRSRAKWAALGAIGATLCILIAARLLDPRMSGGFQLLPKERMIVDLLVELGPRLRRVLDFTLAELLFRVTPGALFGNRVGLWPIDLLLSITIIATGVRLVVRRVVWGTFAGLSFLQWTLFFPDARYFLPLIPLLLLAWWDLAVTIAARLSDRRGPAILVATAILLCVPNIVRNVGFAIEQHRTPFLETYQRGRYRTMPDLMNAARKTLPPDAVLVSDPYLASALHYWSGLRVVTKPEGDPLQDIPPGRPLFLVLPSTAAIDADLLANGLVRGEAVLEIPRGELAPAAIVRLVPAAPASGNR